MINRNRLLPKQQTPNKTPLTNKQQSSVINTQNEMDSIPFESQNLDPKNINFNSYIPNIVQLRADNYQLAHPHHQLQAYERFQGYGELWYIQKIPGTKNQIRIQARGGEFYRFLAHDDANKTAFLKCLLVSTDKNPEQNSTENAQNKDLCSIPKDSNDQSKERLKFSQEERENIKKDKELIWYLEKIQNDGQKEGYKFLIVNTDSNEKDQRLYLNLEKVNNDQNFVSKFIGKLSGSVTFMTQDQSKETAHWSFEVGAYRIAI